MSTEIYLVQWAAYLLSTLTILSCAFLKVPQILFIREKKSANGIYLQAMLLEILGFSIMTLYNYRNGYSVMTYMEYPIILLQVYVMFYYVLKYQGLINELTCLMAFTYFTIISLFAAGVLSKSILDWSVPLCTPLSGFAKVTYIYGMYKTENADAISLTTWMISAATNAARIFTVYVDSADRKLLFNFCISTVLSTGVLITAIYYQNKEKPKTT